MKMLINGTTSSPAKDRIWISTAAFCLLLGFFLLIWRGTVPFEGLVRAIASRDAWGPARSLASNPKALEKYYALSVGIVLATSATLILGAMVWARLNEATRELIFSATITLACSCALISYMLRMEYDGPWAPVKVLMNNPSSLPIFGHRLLLVWMAKGFQKLVPHLSDLREFYLSQCVAILLTVYALGRWSALYIGKGLSWVGQISGSAPDFNVFRLLQFLRYRPCLFYHLRIVRDLHSEILVAGADRSHWNLELRRSTSADPRSRFCSLR
jgi:hypothetical protein